MPLRHSQIAVSLLDVFYSAESSLSIVGREAWCQSASSCSPTSLSSGVIEISPQLNQLGTMQRTGSLALPQQGVCNVQEAPQAGPVAAQQPTQTQPCGNPTSLRGEKGPWGQKRALQEDQGEAAP